jgi:hypothetical protein
MLERSAIENRDAFSIARTLQTAFEQHCVTAPQPRQSRPAADSRGRD